MIPFFPFSTKEFLDLLLISFLLHRLYLLFRGTTALQVVVGVFSLWVLYFGAERAGLVLTTRFFQAMAAVGAVGLIIIFRREIREVLLHTNPGRFFLGQPGSLARIDPEEAASAAFHLAEKGIGCLICFQGRDNVEEFVEGGVVVDGKFGGAIIESIFTRESPLHDGAVIVRNGRITRAGGLLPLTTEKDVPEKFGTRHRAALGLSECCDAVILVVSEERGEVSLVHRGRIEAFAESRELRQRLPELLKKPEARYSRRNLSFEGLRQAGGLALVFLMVTVLWNLYLGSGDSLTSIQVPVELRNVPEHTTVSHDFEKHFMVRVSGKNPLIEALQPNQVSAFIDLEGLSMGKHTLTIDAKNIRLPPGLRIEQVEPETVEIRLERRMERELPVRVVFSGRQPNGGSVVGLEPAPGKVRVVGPRSQLEQLTHVSTVPIALEDLEMEEQQEVTARLGALPPSVSLAPGTNRKVRVLVEMRR